MDRDELKRRLENCSNEKLIELILEQYDVLTDLCKNLASEAYSVTTKTVGY